MQTKIVRRERDREFVSQRWRVIQAAERETERKKDREMVEIARLRQDAVGEGVRAKERVINVNEGK